MSARYQNRTGKNPALSWEISNGLLFGLLALFARQKARQVRAANRAFALGGTAAVFHLDNIRVLDGAFFFALDTVRFNGHW
jgi:hypothetical protein